MKLTEVAVHRPIATTMVFLIVIVLGITAFRYLPVDLLPQIEYPQLTVRTNYPNVGPEEIETLITDRIENALAGVPNVERMRSNSEEGGSSVTLEFAQGTNIDEAANDVRAALDRVRDAFPPEVESPRLWKFDPDNFPVVVMGASSPRGLEELTRLLEREIAQRFEQIPGAGAVDVFGGIYREIQVRLRRDRLASSRLTATDVAAALERENVTLPGGDLREGLNDLYVRTRGEFESVDQIAQTIITVIDGKPIRVGDVAEVVDGQADVNRIVQIDGKPMVRLAVRKQSGANTVEVARQARAEMERINAERDDLELMLVMDQSAFIQNSIDNVKKSTLWGGLLALVILYLFLRHRSTTIIIGLAIPISIIASFGLLYFGKLTLNQMSFGGLALGIGMVVDSAIVVLENIVRRREDGLPPTEAALSGTKQVTGAIIASTLTTMVIFLPVVFMQTISGILFRELALVVVFALACSLIVALTLVPMLSSRYLHVSADEGHARRGAWLRAVEATYARWLAATLRRPKAVIGATLLLLAATIGLWQLLPVELAPQTDADEVSVELEMAQGTNIAVVKEYLEELERVVREAAPQEDVEHMSIEIRGGNAEVELALLGAGERKLESSVIADEIRRRVAGRIPGAELRVQAQSGLWMLRRLFGSGGGEAVELELRGYDLDQADRLAQQIRGIMHGVPGVADVRISRREGRPEQNLIVDREKIAQLGLSVSQVARVIQANVGGSQAGVFREGGEEFPIVVRLRPEDRLSALDLGNITVRSATGEVFPVSAVLRAERRRGPTSIARVDGQRVTTIAANLAGGATMGDVVERLQAELHTLALPPGFSLIFSGEYEEQQKARRDFILSIVIALVLIYMVMAAQFERFLDPLIVMAAVPVAIVGVVPTLLLTGTSLNVQSLMGIIMLIGIVVNNAIVLVDYINLMRREQGLGVREAVLRAGQRRLRPILMTTATTVLGMLPLAIGGGAGGEIQAALARAVIGGLAASTLITLFLIPTVYTSVYGLLERRGARAQVAPAPREQAEPA